MPELNDDARLAVTQAEQVARENRHQLATTEHLLFTLLHDPGVQNTLQQKGVDVAALTDAARTFLQVNNPPGRFMGKTPSLDNIVDSAEPMAAGDDEPVTPMDLVRSIVRNGDEDCFAAQFLEQFGADQATLENRDVDERAAAEAGAEEEGEKEETNLDKYCTDLNALAEKGKIDPIIGREDEISGLIVTLSLKKKPNAIMVGEPGVGKTAVAEGFAKRIVDGEAPSVMADNVIFSLEMGKLMAGTRYRGDFEERLEGVISELEEMADAYAEDQKKPENERAGHKKPVLFIDEIHTIIGAGATSGGSMDASNIMKPFLQRGAIRVIGATTEDEYRKHFVKDRAMARRFERTSIKEPSLDDTIKILQGLGPVFGEFHGVEYPDDVLEYIAKQCRERMNDLKDPDKSISIMDSAGASLVLLDEEEKPEAITFEIADAMISKVSRTPPKVKEEDAKLKLRGLADDLKKAVFDQDEACEALAKSYRKARMKPGREERPIGSFLFTGPTGVGKTEVTRQLADILNVPIKRFDMSEYMEKHSVSRLIGAPPGYVGFDQGGQLTDFIDNNPHCVILLDEIEKAHPDVYNILLGVMDAGRLTSHEGKEVDCSNITLIMTSNVGVKEANKQTMGFAKDQDANSSKKREAAVNKLFTPEFRNRLTATIEFDSLKPETMIKIVGKFIGNLDKAYAQHPDGEITLEFTDAAKNYLAEKGFNPAMGARPLQRLMDDEVDMPIVDEMIEGDLATNGGTVYIDFNAAANEGAGGLDFSYECAPPPQEVAEEQDNDPDAEIDVPEEDTPKTGTGGSTPAPGL